MAVLLETDKADQTKRTLHVGNVGDSRAVLVSSKYPATSTPKQDPDEPGTVAPSHGFIATRLTFDHRAEDPAEQERIKIAGGFVTRNRVLGILAVSRSFGDHGMKDFVIGRRRPRVPHFNQSLIICFIFPSHSVRDGDRPDPVRREPHADPGVRWCVGRVLGPGGGGSADGEVPAGRTVRGCRAHAGE